MKSEHIRKELLVLAVAAAVVAIPDAARSRAQETAAKSNRPALRLPNYYSRVSTSEQQVKLREINEQFGPQIQEQRDALQKLIDKRNAAFAKVLKPEQLEEIERLRAARRRAGAGGAAETKPDTAKPDTTKGKSKKAA